MLILKIGRGIPKDGSCNESGAFEAELNPDHSHWTLEQLARQIQKQLNLTDGELVFDHLQVYWSRRKENS